MFHFNSPNILWNCCFFNISSSLISSPLTIFFKKSLSSTKIFLTKSYFYLYTVFEHFLLFRISIIFWFFFLYNFDMFYWVPYFFVLVVNLIYFQFVSRTLVLYRIFNIFLEIFWYTLLLYYLNLTSIYVFNVKGFLYLELNSFLSNTNPNLKTHLLVFSSSSPLTSSTFGKPLVP